MPAGAAGRRPGGPGWVAAGEDSGRDSAGGAGCPVPGDPVDDDRGQRGGGAGAGEGQRAEHAAFYPAEPAGQRHQPRAELAGRAGQQQPAPRHGRAGRLERGGQQPGLAEHAQPAGRQRGGAPARPEPVAGQPGQAAASRHRHRDRPA